MVMKKSLINMAIRIGLEKLANHPQILCYPHYSFIIQNNKLIEYGTNSIGPVPKHLGYAAQLTLNDADPKVHSEYSAWKKARGVMDKNKSFEVLNLRFVASGKLKLSAPCPCCLNFLKEMGCSKIYFSTEAGFAKLTT
jgi:tRNA(Arg) A34 adenosine deaminase TadA